MGTNPRPPGQMKALPLLNTPATRHPVSVVVRRKQEARIETIVMRALAISFSDWSNACQSIYC